MGLWGNSNTAESRPKFLSVDSNAAGSAGARENAIATTGGWGLSPGIAASGNDNPAAQPEILVAIRNLAKVRGTATIQSIDFSAGAVADTGTFDITVTFDEAVDVTSASWTANQTVTNKAYIMLSRIGQTDMVEDSTCAAQYYSGTGTNQITFRGTVQTNAAAGYLGFNGAGVGDDATAGEAGITFNGSADFAEEDGISALALRQEGGSVSTPADRVVLDSTAAITAKTNGAITTASTTLTLDNNSGTIAVNNVVYSLVGATSLTDAQGATTISHDGTLTVTAVASQNSITVSEAVTVADDVDLNFSADGHGSILGDSMDFLLEGVDGATDVMTLTKTGADSSVAVQLEDGTDADTTDRLVQDTAANENDPIVMEDYTSDIVVVSQTGSSSGTASVLNGVTVTAS